MTRLEVWGDPIAHSRSPELHAAAYAALGLEWEYRRRQVGEESFDRELAIARHELRGVSLTMPLKDAAFRVAGRRDARAVLTGVANTLLLRGTDDPWAFNTDIGGLAAAVRAEGVDRAHTARLLGAGATAASAVVAFRELGVHELEIVARTPSRAMALAEQASDLGMDVSIRPLEDVSALRTVDVTVATLPGGTELDTAVASALAQTGGALVDVVYAPWPSALGHAWEAAGRSAASGVEMLLQQALLQVRIFVTEQVNDPLPDEATVLAKMRSALMPD